MGQKRLKITFSLFIIGLLVVLAWYWYSHYKKPNETFVKYIYAYNNGINYCQPDNYVEGLLQQGFKLSVNEANSGNEQAEYNVGIAYLAGLGVEKNIQMGSNIMQKLAEQGVANAEVSYGAILAANPRQAIEAEQWYQKAADQGNPYGEVALALSYSQNNSILENQTAFQTLLNQASKKLGIAKYVLAQAYENGYGANQSNAEAIKWYKAAYADPTLPQAYKQDSATALSMLYSAGETVDQEQAQYWGSLAQKLYDEKSCQKID